VSRSCPAPATDPDLSTGSDQDPQAGPDLPNSPAPSTNSDLDIARFTRRSGLLLALTGVLALVTFFWPLFWSVSNLPEWVPVVLLFGLTPLCLGLVVADLANHSLDVAGLAMLGVLTAIGAAVRPLGAGTAGIETVFFLIVIGGRVFGPGFGFVLGSTTLFASALITGGFGAWLPYQMIAAAFVGLGAGMLPRARGRAEVLLLGVYAAIAGFVYGALMDFAFWPFTLGSSGQTGLSYDAALGIGGNLRRFLIYETVTAFGWNLGRAITTVLLLVLLGPAVMHVLRRTTRRAVFLPAEGTRRE
jgi:energy-coupling factor transport system substrate-specific component